MIIFFLLHEFHVFFKLFFAAYFGRMKEVIFGTIKIIKIITSQANLLWNKYVSLETQFQEHTVMSRKMRTKMRTPIFIGCELKVFFEGNSL